MSLATPHIMFTIWSNALLQPGTTKWCPSHHVFNLVKCFTKWLLGQGGSGSRGSSDSSGSSSGSSGNSSSSTYVHPHRGQVLKMYLCPCLWRARVREHILRTGAYTCTCIIAFTSTGVATCTTAGTLPKCLLLTHTCRMYKYLYVCMCCVLMQEYGLPLVLELALVVAPISVTL